MKFCDLKLGMSTKEVEDSYVAWAKTLTEEEKVLRRVPDRAGTPYEEWKASAINKIFNSQGNAPKPANITAATIRNQSVLE